MNHPFLIYLAAINIISGTIFAFDKFCAEKKCRRVPEKTLHLLEAIGGIPIVLVLMRGLHHKCSKKSYYWKTYLIALLWVVGIGVWWYLRYGVGID